MKSLLLISFIVIQPFVFGQKDKQEKTKEKIPHKYNLAYKVPLLSYLDFTNPSLNFGIEKTFSNKIGLYQEVAFLSNKLNPLFRNINIHKNASNGFKLLLQPMVYLYSNTNTSLFLSPSIQYKYVFENIKNQEFSRFGGQYFQLFNYSSHKHVMNIIPKIGINKIKRGKVFGFEFSGGLGLKVIHFSPKKYLIPSDAEVANNNNNPFLELRTTSPFGTYLRPSITINLALIFLDKKNR